MKRILITGANSYIGENFENYLLHNYPDQYLVETLDMRDASWREKSFSDFDAIFHVAGIAHADVSHVTDEVKKKYYQVNTDLAVETAKKAKLEGAKQFVFMSSMIVYGGEKYVSQDTIPHPANFYGDSKWQADQQLQQMMDENFTTTVLRPPMIYGKNSKGNYPALAKLACKLPVFPKVNNRRSMLYVENLCEFVRIVIDQKMGGVFFPQNQNYVNTSELVKEIAWNHGKNIKVWKWLSCFVHIGMRFPGKIGILVQKAFGDSYYDLEMSDIGVDYNVCDWKESIRRTEGE